MAYPKNSGKILLVEIMLIPDPNSTQCSLIAAVRAGGIGDPAYLAYQ